MFAEPTDDGTEQPTLEASLMPERPSASPGPDTAAWRVSGKLQNILLVPFAHLQKGNDNNTDHLPGLQESSETMLKALKMGARLST